MSLFTMLYTALIWLVGIVIIWFFFIEVVLRIVRHFVDIPAPYPIVALIDNPIRRKIQPPKKVIDWIGIEEGMYVLEVGSGVGTFTLEAAKHLGTDGKLYAIDIQPGVISKLDEKIRKHNIKNVIARVASAYELPFPDKYFDRVFMVTVLGEIPDKRRALLEIKRVLKDDGILAIGELLLDPDYPLRKSVINWCEEAGFRLVGEHGGILHYLLKFKKAESESAREILGEIDLR